jgi:cardiolipin synthase
MPINPTRGPAQPSVTRTAETPAKPAPSHFDPVEHTTKIEDIFEKAGKAVGFLGAEIEGRFDPFKHLSSWEDDSKKMLAKVAQTAPPPGAATSVSDPQFLAGLETLAGAKFHQGNQVRVLADGPKACDEWVDTIQNASQSIHMQSWAFYDDATGGRIADALVAKAKQGVDVRVMVDGQTGASNEHKHVLEYMEQNGVKLVRWENPDRKYFGLHSKVLVVDGDVPGKGKVISGGRNPGDWYFDTNPNSAKWRDTELEGQGPMVTDAEALFARRWNDQVSGRKLQLDTVTVPPPPADLPTGAKVMVVGNEPKVSEQSDDKILLTTLKAVEGAKKSFDIENAYFIVQSPEHRDALREALQDAIKRGVKVRVFTNSDTSVDEPAVSTPIVNSAIQLANAGAEVYLKKGDTLHSKYWVADGELAMVSSYNNHPRSHYYEAESAMVVADQKFASEMEAHFDQGASEATRVAPGTPFKPESLGSRLSSMFEDQL